MKAGDSWSADRGPERKGKVVYTVGEPEEVVVPAGKFRVLCVTTTLKEGDNTRVLYKEYLSENIGLVKHEEDGGAMVLKSFVPGKDK